MEAQFDPTIQIPQEVLAAARLIGNWAKENNYKKWQLLDVCSRNFAFELEDYLNYGKEKYYSQKIKY